MSYHSIHLEFPANAPFDTENWFETFVGRFVKPLLATGLVKQYWFTRYGDDKRREIRLRLTTDDFAALQPTIKKQIGTFGFTDINDEAKITVIESFLNDRVYSPDSPNPSADNRGQLLLNINHALSTLFVDTLIGPDANGRFRQEKNANANNPHGSVFETVHHLLCNTTDLVTEIEMLQFGEGQLILQSPVYASYTKADLGKSGIPFSELGKMRVRF
jgi:hypothetical protein